MPKRETLKIATVGAVGIANPSANPTSESTLKNVPNTLTEAEIIQKIIQYTTRTMKPFVCAASYQAIDLHKNNSNLPYNVVRQSS